jgi:hypothetical protein
LKRILRKFGLLPLAGWLRHELPREHRFRRFRARYGELLRRRAPGSPQARTALLVTGPHTSLLVDLWLIKGLELAGYATVVMALDARHWDRYYRLAGASHVHAWNDFRGSLDHLDEAKAIVERSPSQQDIARFEYAGARVGRIALSTALRELRLGTLQLESSPAQRQHLADLLARSMALADAARELLRRVAPDFAVFYDMVYLRRGELFDLCLQDRIRTVVWHPAHKNNHLILKTYGLENREDHPVSLSPDSWSLMERMAWTDARRARLRSELSGAYARGDWYGESGTQFSKRVLARSEVRTRLGLDPGRKTAFIFAHIAWDAPLSWGESLFESYEQWLIETVRAACRNDKVNWVIKIHPANVGKQLKEQYLGEPAEQVALRRQVGALPPHVVLLRADSEISTFALFELMDYCLTVRGTIGIEAASLGIPVITAGTGRYDRRGFTVDSASRGQYLDRIRRIQDIAPLAPPARELAERFAYGVFVSRPFPLEAISLEFSEEAGPKSNFTRSCINAGSAEAWHSARDLALLARWLGDPQGAEFLMPIVEKQEAGH